MENLQRTARHQDFYPKKQGPNRHGTAKQRNPGPNIAIVMPAISQRHLSPVSGHRSAQLSAAM
jgi:hypothetical protein